MVTCRRAARRTARCAPLTNAINAINAFDAFNAASTHNALVMDQLDQQNFSSYEAALKAIREHQAAKGFVVAVSSSRVDRKTGFKHGYVRCQNSGSYRRWANSARQYNTSTKKTGCPFSAQIRLDRPNRAVQVKVLHHDHNHEAISEPRASSRLRLHTQRQFGVERLHELVETHCQNPGAKPKDIALALTQDHPELLINPSDVFFIRRHLRL